MSEHVKTPEPGLYRGVPSEEYRHWKALSVSASGQVLRSCRHLQEYYEHPKPSTEAQIFGNLVDCLILEPEKLDDRYEVIPATYMAKGKKKDDPMVEKPWNMNSNTCKDIWKGIMARGRWPIKQEDLNVAKLMRDSVNAHESAREMIMRGESQVSLLWIDPDTGITCKARLDLLVEEGEQCITDLKTTQDASPEEFRRSIYHFGYHRQAAMFTEGYAILHEGLTLPYNIIAVEKEAPYCVATYNLQPDSILAGRKQFRDALTKYKDYKELNNREGYSRFIEPIDIPGWALARAIEEGAMSDDGI